MSLNARARVGVLFGAGALACLSMTGVMIASTFTKMDIPSLSRGSEAVVHARVVEINSDWNADRSMIFTHVTLQVIRSLRGDPRATVTVRVPGGTVGELTTVMVGGPRFEMNQEVVAFLAPWDDGVPGVMGYAQGLSQVRREPNGRTRLRGGAADGLSIRELTGLIGRSVR